MSAQHQGASAPVAVAGRVEDLLRAVTAVGIRIPVRDEVHDYLLWHPDMTGIVGRAVTTAQQTFEPAAQLSLEVYHDPELPSSAYLVLYARSAMPDLELLATTDRVAAALAPALAQASGWLVVTTDFQPAHAVGQRR